MGPVLEGHATAAFADGRSYDLAPGTLFAIPSEPHDRLVVGDARYVSLHFLGASDYARSGRPEATVAGAIHSKRTENHMTGTPTLTQSIGQAESALRAVLDSLLAETGTTFVQWVTMNMIARGDSAVQRDQLVHRISSALKIDEPTVRSTLGELTELGLVTTALDEPARVELTTAGDTRFHSLRQSIDRVTGRLYGDLPVDELATTRRVLGIVTERANVELGR